MYHFHGSTCQVFICSISQEAWVLLRCPNADMALACSVEFCRGDQGWGCGCLQRLGCALLLSYPATGLAQGRRPVQGCAVELHNTRLSRSKCSPACGGVSSQACAGCGSVTLARARGVCGCCTCTLVPPGGLGAFQHGRGGCCVKKWLSARVASAAGSVRATTWRVCVQGGGTQ